MGNSPCNAGPSTRHETIHQDGFQYRPKARNCVFPMKASNFLDPKRQTGDGECLIFMEQAKHLPSSDVFSTVTCGATGGNANGYPFACAWAEENGKPLGKASKWATRASSDSPSWFSAHSLGFVLGQHKSATLHIEFWDSSSLIAEFVSPFNLLPKHSPLTKELESKTGRKAELTSTVSFQVLDSKEMSSDHRTVFFVRHGECAGDVLDGSLSETGRNQAENLGCKMAQSAQDRSSLVSPLLRPDVIYASPLSQAVQTAVIAFGPLVMRLNGLKEIVLMANAREKQSSGGMDRSGSVGDRVPRKAFEALKALYPENADPGKVLECFKKTRFDTQEVEDVWWGAGGAETSPELAERLQEFVSQLLYSPHKTSVVVGHSDFFREVFRGFMSDELKLSKADFCNQLCAHKLGHCSMIRVDFDPRRGLNGGPIVRAELVLRSRLESEGPVNMGICCPANRQVSIADGRELHTDSGEPEKYLRYPVAQDLAGLNNLLDAGRNGHRRFRRSVSMDSTAASSSHDPFHGVNVAKFKRSPSSVSIISNPRRQASNVSSCYSSVNGNKQGRNKIEW